MQCLFSLQPQTRIGYSNLPKLIILTGPQGSGNHLFSKLLALNPAVHGWSELLEEYWIGHDQEPFAQHWINPPLLDDFDWTQSDVFVTSISCPYAFNGEYVDPNYTRFIEHASKYANIQIVLIGRDKNILEHQQQRVREQVTLPRYMNKLNELLAYNPIFVSQESLYLYGIHYVNWLERELGLLHTTDQLAVNQILENDTNKKYIKNVDQYWLDSVAQKASKHRKAFDYITVIKYTSALIILSAMVLHVAGITPWNSLLQMVGASGWIYVGYKWKEKALILNFLPQFAIIIPMLITMYWLS